jgi:hypothetical protein
MERKYVTDRSHGNVTTQENKTNYMAFVRKQTIPTERPPLVGEVSANFS